ncbi:MAG: phospho-sugar mutase [Clostridiales Family XIII bacterium]|jgi:phosphoglucomutase|nr:phospho-sugar mutase [Clostridiales Family XIII bacterium]
MITTEIAENVRLWLEQPDLAEELRAELSALERAAANDPNGAAADELNDRFYRDLEFGTAGMRGVIGAGSNRMNLYTVRRITQGLADYINAEKRDAATRKRPSVAIGYDNRIQSDAFAFETACVLLANGIDVYIYPALAPTPALSFAVRHCGCDAGVMITASHNTKEYNGYKVYDSAGEQSLPNEADAIAARIESVKIFGDVKTVALAFGGPFAERLAVCAARPADGGARLTILPDGVMDAFIEAVLALSMGKRNFSGFSAVYTPLNGTGNIPVRRALAAIGLTDLHIVREQEAADGEFPTCPYPNPEKKEALARGLALCERLRAEGRPPDILLATDPDCDRVGVAVLHKGAYRLLTGNEVGVLLLDFICRSRKAAGTMPKKPVAVKTIVSSPLAAAVAERYGVEMINVLTGFKFIGRQITLLEERGEAERYIFGFEESCGYMSGTHVRDKDAVNACVLIAELAAACKEEGRTIADRLEEICRAYGFCENALIEFAMDGESGMKRIGRIMRTLRERPPRELFHAPVAETADYLSSRRLAADGRESGIDLPKADVLEFVFSDGTGLIARPSGTEPKLKIYLAVSGATREASVSAAQVLREEIGALIDGIA